MLNAICVMLVVASNRFVAEAAWFTTFLAYIPQPILCISTLILLMWSAVRRRWRVCAGQGALLLLAAWLLLGFQIHFDSPRSSPRLRVMSFNIQVATHGIENVLATIKEQKPNVFCLQECNPTAQGSLVEMVAKGMPGYHVVNFEGLVIGSRFPVISSRTVPLPPGSINLPIFEAVIDWNGRHVRVADVHLLPVRIDMLLAQDPSAIPAHLRKIAAQHEGQFEGLLRYAASDSTPLVLAGDFNSPATGLLHAKLAKALNDSFAVAGTGLGYTIPATFPLIRMDYVYTSADLRPLGCWVSSRVASDHRAVITELISARRAE